MDSQKIIIQKIIIIDQTIREGMQYHGLMFSNDQRLKIIEFQEALGVDVSQAGYPPAHKSEAENVKSLYRETQKRGYAIRVSGLYRALADDVRPMVKLGFKDFQLHVALTKEMLERTSVDVIYKSLEQTVALIRSEVSEPVIDVSLLDMGNTDMDLLEECAGFLIDELEVDILTLPDTSGIRAPNLIFDRVASIVKLTIAKKTRIGIHCHNDMGMATANTIMGVAAGALVVQVTALGIGERNGIGDIFLVGKCLKDQGYPINLKTENKDLFEQYYKYINGICLEQTNTGILNYNTPVFSPSMETHVAGTHGIASYGSAGNEAFFLNVLCGKHMVEKYLHSNNIRYDKDNIKEIVAGIKDKSAELGRFISKKEVVDIVIETGG